MDPVLVNEEIIEGNLSDYEIKLWVVEEDFIRPSSHLKIKKNLDPGMYIIDLNREFGLHCKKVQTCSDKLYEFDDDTISKLLAEIDIFWDKKDVYKENNLVHKRGILLEGYPGTGKTSIISLLSDRIIKRGGVVFKITSPKNIYYYTGFIKDCFRKIQPDTPIVTIIEDIDSYMEEASSELLDLLDGKSNIEHNLFITTTNNTEDIDDTFLRPSRIDLRIEMGLPTESIRKQYFIAKGVSEDNVSELVSKSDDFSFADLKELYICTYILGYSTNSAIEKIKNEVKKKNYSNKGIKNSGLTI